MFIEAKRGDVALRQEGNVYRPEKTTAAALRQEGNVYRPEKTTAAALRQEGNVYRSQAGRRRPPPGGQCL